MAEKHKEKGEHDSHGGGGGGHGGGGHGGGGGHEEAHEGAPEWLISFADNVALLMGFFVILLAMNMNKQTTGGIGGEGEMAMGGESAEMLDFAIAMREIFHNPVDITGTDPRDDILRRRLIQRAGKSETKDPGVKGYEHDVQTIRPGDYYALSAKVLFSDDSAEISPSALVVIDELAEKVKGRKSVIEVRGHTSVSEAYQRRDQAFRLSFNRAHAVASALVERGVEWWQIRLVGCADTERANSSPRTRSDDGSNGRVEVIVSNSAVADDVPTSPESTRRSSPEHAPAH
jgi:chemotaxis protein MotB